MDKLKEGDKVTFPDLPVAFDCHGPMIDIKGITKCGNMDAYMVNGELEGKAVSFLISVPAVLALMRAPDDSPITRNFLGFARN